MPWLAATQPLPGRPSRVIVAGTSGAGKTTFGRLLAAELDVSHFEIDALHHGPEWTVRSEFLPDVQRWADSPAWVTEWQYGRARPVLAARADLMVWLDLPRWLVMARLGRRTVRRSVRREVAPADRCAYDLASRLLIHKAQQGARRAEQHPPNG